MTKSLLELRDIECQRDGRSLFAGLCLQVDGGDIVQVEGPNGSGKTTLLRVLTTASNDYCGEIFWQGSPLASRRFELRSQLLYLGHSPGIKKSLSPRENLGWYMGMCGARTNSSGGNSPVESALYKVGLLGYEDVPCHNLSAGQLRRVALARLYLNRARLWILDEPFTAIDRHGVANLEHLITNHAASGGVVIMTTHQDLSLKDIKRLNLLQFPGSTS